MKASFQFLSLIFDGLNQYIVNDMENKGVEYYIIGK